MVVLGVVTDMECKPPMLAWCFTKHSWRLLLNLHTVWKSVSTSITCLSCINASCMWVHGVEKFLCVNYCPLTDPKLVGIMITAPYCGCYHLKVCNSQLLCMRFISRTRSVLIIIHVIIMLSVAQPQPC